MKNEYKEQWKTDLGKLMKETGERISFSQERQEKILADIHCEIQERRKIMRFSSRKKAMLIGATAAIVMLGTVTAIGAGTVTGLFTSVRTDQATYTSSQQVKEGAEVMGAVPKAVAEFDNGLQFQKGYLTQVEGRDDSGTVVGTYPSIMLEYEDGINLTIERPFEKMKGEGQEAGQTAEYRGTVISVTQDNYLFLPPDGEPSPEDQALAAAGQLYISYGSEKEEREVFTNVTWKEDGLTYLLFTSNTEYSADEMVQMAKEVIDEEV